MNYNKQISILGDKSSEIIVGAIPFGGADMSICQDPINLTFDDTTNTLTVGKVTQNNTAAPSAAGDLMTASAYQMGVPMYGVDSGAANAVVVTLAPAPAAYVAGMTVRVKIAANNTGACTINVNGLGAQSILSNTGGTPASAALTATVVYTLTYDGTSFYMQ